MPDATAKANLVDGVTVAAADTEPLQLSCCCCCCCCRCCDAAVVSVDFDVRLAVSLLTATRPALDLLVSSRCCLLYS